MFSESDISALVSIFGQIGNRELPFDEKRRKLLQALGDFFQARTWKIENTPSLQTDQGTRQLRATKNDRTLVLEREAKEPTFTKREHQLFQLVTSHAPWLLGDPIDSPQSSPHLSPRMKTVCFFVCLGAGRKEIASALGLEQGSVDAYVRDLYKIYGVRSQREFIRLHGGTHLPDSQQHKQTEQKP